MDVLQIKGLKKSFGKKEVLRGVDLSVPTGSVFGFIGRNGAGKTTLMKLTLGLLFADGGEICVAGERVRYGQTETNRMIGYLPDVPSFYGFYTAREYLTLCGECLGMRHSDIAERSEELLEIVGLHDERHRIKGFSRGMKQRLGIAQALIASPKLLICDEPTSALDPVGRKEILSLLQSIKDRTTVFFSTHILSDVERICTHAALLQEGEIKLCGGVDSLRSQLGRNEILAEMETNADAMRLSECLGGICRVEDRILTLAGDADRMREVLGIISEQRLSALRVERTEPSLEALFEEVER